MEATAVKLNQNEINQISGGVILNRQAFIVLGIGFFAGIAARKIVDNVYPALNYFAKVLLPIPIAVGAIIYFILSCKP